MKKKPTPSDTPVSKVSAPLAAVPATDTLYKKLFFGWMALMLVLIPFFSKDTGINGDERFQTYLAKYVVPFYTSFGKDRRIFLTKNEVLPVFNKGGMDSVKKQFNLDDVPQNNDLKNYGCGYELWSAVIARMFGYPTDQVMGYHLIRHVVLAFITVFIILFTGLIAKEILGWRAAFITVLLLSISPRFIGDGMMNNKDIPFALGYIATIYFVILFLRKLPFPTWKNTLLVTLGFAMAINIRVGGIMLFFSFGLFVGLFWLYYQYIAKNRDFNGATMRTNIMRVMIACVAGYFLGLIFWPYGLLSPISNPLSVLQEQSHQPTVIGQLFEGKVISSPELPRYYLVKLMSMSIPTVVILGSILSVAMLYLNRKRINMGFAGLVVFSIVFPLGYIAYAHANVYNGWRHAIFVYPFIVILAALGYDLLIDTMKTKALKVATVVAMVGLSIMPVTWILAEHPYEYTYYNELAGGIKETYGYYDNDYYMLSIREATDWLVKNELSKAQSPTKILVTSDCVYPMDIYLKNSPVKDKVQALYTSYRERNNKDWDYGIFYGTYVSPYQLQKGLWPPDGTIYTVKAGGVPLCCVVKRTNKSDFLGHAALEKGDFANAIAELEKAKIASPNNDGVFTDLGLAYLQVKDMNKGIEALSQSLKLNNDNYMVCYYLGIAYAQVSPPNYDYTERYMKMALKINPNFQQAQDVLNQIRGAQQSKSPF